MRVKDLSTYQSNNCILKITPPSTYVFRRRYFYLLFFLCFLDCFFAGFFFGEETVDIVSPAFCIFFSSFLASTSAVTLSNADTGSLTKRLFFFTSIRFNAKPRPSIPQNTGAVHTLESFTIPASKYTNTAENTPNPVQLSLSCRSTRRYIRTDCMIYHRKKPINANVPISPVSTHCCRYQQ